MAYSGDAAEQVVRISLDGVEYIIKIAGAGAKNLASLLLAAIETKKSTPPTLKVSGSERLKRMIQSGEPLDVFSVREKDLRTFMKESKTYGIVYCSLRAEKPSPDGTVDFLVRQADSPRINRIIERLEYSAIDIGSTKTEKGAEPPVPDKFDNPEVDSFLDDIMPNEGKSTEKQNQATQPPDSRKSVPEVEEPFFSTARTSENPSEHGLDTSNRHDERTTEPASVKEEIRQIRSGLKREAENRKNEPQRTGKAQQASRHHQPQNTRTSKSKNTKER